MTPLLAAYLYRIGLRDSATCPHCNGADETAEHLVLQHTTRRGGSHGQISTIKATQDAYGASWRGSGRWPVTPTGNERERERERERDDLIHLCNLCMFLDQEPIPYRRHRSLLYHFSQIGMKFCMIVRNSSKYHALIDGVGFWFYIIISRDICIYSNIAQTEPPTVNINCKRDRPVGSWW